MRNPNAPLMKETNIKIIVQVGRFLNIWHHDMILIVNLLNEVIIPPQLQSRHIPSRINQHFLQKK